MSSTASNGALVIAGSALWMSVGEGPIDPSSLPVAIAGAALAICGMASLYHDDRHTPGFRLLFDLRPY